MLTFHPAQAARTPDYITAAAHDQRQAGLENERKAHKKNALMSSGLDILSGMGGEGGMSNPMGWAALAALALDAS